MNNLFFERNGILFMRVTPVKSLFHSTMVHDVITKGGQFVVNMETGELTIYREKSQKEYFYYYYRNDGSARKLSSDLDVARVQLADEFTNKFTAGTFTIQEKIANVNLNDYTARTIVTVVAKKNWKVFLGQVEKAYKLMKR